MHQDANYATLHQLHYNTLTLHYTKYSTLHQLHYNNNNYYYDSYRYNCNYTTLHYTTLH